MDEGQEAAVQAAKCFCPWVSEQGCCHPDTIRIRDALQRASLTECKHTRWSLRQDCRVGFVRCDNCAHDFPMHIAFNSLKDEMLAAIEEKKNV